MTHQELLRRALWVCRRAHTLHVLSYELGRNSHLAELGDMPEHVVQLRQFLEESDRVLDHAASMNATPRQSRRRIRLQVASR